MATRGSATFGETSFVAGAAETLSMEAPAPPATPSPAVHLAARTRNPISCRHAALSPPPAFTRKRAQAMKVNTGGAPELVCSGFAMDGDAHPPNVSNIPQKNQWPAEKFLGCGRCPRSAHLLDDLNPCRLIHDEWSYT